MNTILSIDLDILFSPYVGIYNHYIFNDKPLEYLWSSISQELNIEDFQINENYLNYIKNILNNYIPFIDTIYIGKDHSSILQAIEDNKNNFTKPYNFIIHNIDYHHDIVYGDNQQDKVIRCGIADCGDWVGYLNYYKMIFKYYWYRGIGSEYNKGIIPYSELTPNMDKQIFNKNFPLDLNIDLLFISMSFPWIPNCYYSKIKDLILELPQEKIKYYKYPFFINEDKPNFLLLKGDKCNDYFNFN